jgi:lactate dehydrogenase-like 2-hydroxyacid dehydrogenase
MISTMSVGCDHIDTKLLKERTINLYNTPDVLTDTTADLAILLLLATMRRAIESVDLLRSGNVKEWSPTGMCGIGLQNKTIGIVGLGRIGMNIAERLIPFKIKNIIYHSRSAKQSSFEKVEFEKLLRISDLIIIACELNEETRNLFGFKEFSMMKNDVIFVNIARGAIVNQQDLCKCLDLGMFAGVGLDVTDPEPLDADHPLLTNYGGKVVVFPHIGSATFETREAMASMALNQILDNI